MIHNAEQVSGPKWSATDDPRVTRIGKMLRMSRLDEIPQLFNIIKGDMSLVGPRPIRAFFADKLSDMIFFYDLRFAVKPGLTGWAQINAEYAASYEAQIEKFQYDLFYLENMSLILDLYIIIKTIQKIFLGGGGNIAVGPSMLKFFPSSEPE